MGHAATRTVDKGRSTPTQRTDSDRRGIRPYRGVPRRGPPARRAERREEGRAAGRVQRVRHPYSLRAHVLP